MIDANGKEQLMLRNPADTKGGFWLTYLVDGVLYEVSSTERETISIDSKESEKGRVRIVLNHKPVGSGSPIAKFDIEVWSYNKPIMLIRHRITNLSDKIIEDMKLYNFMDFDVGGPSSYKDDIGVYEEETGLISACDDNPLCVVMASKPVSYAWEIASPLKLKVNNENRDLKKNLELGPGDIATNLDEARALIKDGWERFEKKIR